MTDKTQGSAIWNRGIVFANNAVNQSTFQDLGNPHKSVDIRGNPEFGVYQSSADSHNYFAGKTGVGDRPSDAMLSVGGDIQYSGKLLRTRGKLVHQPLLGSASASDSLTMHSGNCQLNDASKGVVLLPSELDAITHLMLCIIPLEIHGNLSLCSTTLFMLNPG